MEGERRKKKKEGGREGVSEGDKITGRPLYQLTCIHHTPVLAQTLG